MKSKAVRFSVFVVFVVFFATKAFAQGTAFMYQGSLNDSGHPATGSYDLTFTLYDSLNPPGDILGETVTNLGTSISNGLFNATLDFGSVFDGSGRWLEIGVRTNGGTNFVILNPRQPVLPVPYAIYAGNVNLAPVASLVTSASNGLYSAVQSSFSTNLASFTNNGLQSYQDAVLQASASDQQQGIQAAPIRGYLTFFAYGANPSEMLVSNVMASTKTWGLYGYGYTWIFIDDGWGTTNRDANGNLQWNTNKFPSGSNFVKIAHQMGFKLALYTDGGNNNGGTTSSGAQAASDAAHMAQDVNQFLNWGVDGGKWDEYPVNLELGMAVLATNTSRPFYVIAGDPNGGPVTAQWVSLVNAFRGLGGGDLVSFQELLAWCDQFMTNGFYRWIRPGHFYDFDAINSMVNRDVEPATFRGTQGQIVMAAITSAIMLHSFSDVNGNITTNGPVYQMLTDQSVLDIEADPAAIAGQRVLQTNGIDVWLKPLGSGSGPQFAIGLICRGASSNINLTIPLDPTGLNLPALSQPGNISAGYSIYDCISNTWVSPTPTRILTITLTNHQSGLFRLFPGAAVVTNYLQPLSYAPTLPAMVVSNGVQNFVNVPWDTDATNFIARAQVANDPVQCFAIQFLFTKLKSFGFWTNRFDVLYPMIPAAPYLNVFSTNFTIAPVGAVVTNAQGISGDGTDSYFTNNYHFINSAVNLSLKSASVGVYNGTATPTGAVMIGNFDGTNQIALLNSPGAIYANINDSLPSAALGFSGSCAGLLVASRLDPATSYIFGRAGLINRGVLAVAVPNAYCFFDGESRGFQCNAQLRGAWIGGGFSPAEMSALNNIWDAYEAILGRQAP
ncbi:MAG TPA: hypothetical protein VKV04_04870 [Verrucomicrobiae bacterium]|nr:hypothetical protein [Verrucomicrobiae bacterium]